MEHFNSVGKLIKERKTGPRCKCKLKCFEKICEEDRLGIIKSFNSISNKEKQDTYLCGLIKIKSVERKSPRTGVKNSKLYIGNFLIRISMIENNVCKKALCSMHGITLSRVNRRGGSRGGFRRSADPQLIFPDQIGVLSELRSQ